MRELKYVVHKVIKASPIRASTLIATSLLQGLLPVATTLLISVILNQVVQSYGQVSFDQSGQIKKYLTLQAAVFILTALAPAFYQIHSQIISERINREMMLTLLRKSTQLPLEDFENAKTHDELRNALNEANGRVIETWNGMLQTLQHLVTLVASGFLITMITPVALPLLFAAPVVNVVLTNYFSRQRYFLSLRQTSQIREKNYLAGILTSDQYMKEVRIFKFFNRVSERWTSINDHLFQEAYRLNAKNFQWSTLSSLTSAVLVGIALYLSTEAVVTKQLSIGSVSIILSSTTQIHSRISGILSSFMSIANSLQYIKNFSLFINTVQKNNNFSNPDSIHTLEVNNLTLSYPGHSHKVVNGVSFKARRGDLIAIVGANGSGKSSLVRALCGFIDTYDGDIKINDQVIHKNEVNRLTSRVSAVFQDHAQYHLSLRENINLGSPDKELDSELPSLLKAASIHFYYTFPQNIDQKLGRLFHDSTQLSGGQWQRLAIARGLAKDADIFILDEPTSALDPHSEIEIIQNIRKLAQDKVVILVSHRLTNLTCADLIINMQKGKIIESGTHPELIEKKGSYAEMYLSQTQGVQIQPR